MKNKQWIFSRITNKLRVKMLRVFQESVGVTITRSTLNFLPTKFSHNKYLKCKGENPNIHGSAISDGYRLSVLCKCKYIYLSIQKIKMEMLSKK